MSGFLECLEISVRPEASTGRSDGARLRYLSPTLRYLRASGNGCAQRRASIPQPERGSVDAPCEGFDHQLEWGSVEADIVHRSGTDWSFAAGPFEVAVLGTQLHVSWQPEAGQFELRVARGAVRVRGPLIQDSQDVQSGQLYRVDLRRKMAGFGQAARATDIERPPAEAPAPPAPRASAPSAPPHPVSRVFALLSSWPKASI